MINGDKLKPSLPLKNKEYGETCIRTLPFQKCHGPKLLLLTFHVMHPPQQSQMFDSRLDLSCYLGPEKSRRNNF